MHEGIKNSFYGKHHSKETKEKIAKHFRGQKLPEKTKRKISQKLKGRISPMKGRHQSKQAKIKISKALKGKEKPEEMKRKISGDKNHNWKNGRKKSRGYILILCVNHPLANSDGYVFEHRLIKEKEIGRYLKLEERVHHLNKIKDDNQPENLKLFPNESEHQKFEQNSHQESPKGG